MRAMNKIFLAKYGNYWILCAVFVVSIVCRLISTASSNVIPGLGSMYYPLQVRCLLEKGTLGFNDMPLVFWLEALLAKLIILVSNAPVNNCIVLACKLVNVIVPSLIVVPVFFIAKSVSNNTIKPFYLAVVLALSVLNPSVLVIFAVDFDKNAIGMLFTFTAIYYLWLYINNKKTMPAVMAVLSVLLTLLTHFGCFSSLFVLLIIFVLVSGVFYYKNWIAWLKKSRIRIFTVVLVICVLALLPVIVKLYDNQRFLHLTSYIASPIQLFCHSFFILMLKGEFIYDWPNMFFLIVLNLFSVLSVIAYFRLRKRMRKEESIFYLTLVLWYVFLSSPFINTEIYNRLLFISLIALTIIIIFVFSYFKRPVKMTIAIILTLLLILTVATNGVHRTYISKEEYGELKQMTKFIPQPSSTIVLAQHRLEFWTSWTLHIRSGQLRGIKPSEYPKYSTVLYIVQKSNQYKEDVPKAAVLIHTGQYFDLYKIYSK